MIEAYIDSLEADGIPLEFPLRYAADVVRDQSQRTENRLRAVEILTSLLIPKGFVFDFGDEPAEVNVGIERMRIALRMVDDARK